MCPRASKCELFGWALEHLGTWVVALLLNLTMIVLLLIKTMFIIINFNVTVISMIMTMIIALLMVVMGIFDDNSDHGDDGDGCGIGCDGVVSGDRVGGDMNKLQ